MAEVGVLQNRYLHTDEHGHFWREQNQAKDSKCAKLAREGHDVAWEFDNPDGRYTWNLLIDGKIYTTREATIRFLTPTKKHSG